MTVNINSKSTATAATNVAELVAELRLPAVGVAVAIDNKMVARTAWEATALVEGANIVIIKAACGG